MSEREELEAEIKAIEEAWLFSEDAVDTAGRRRHLATALLSSGYTKADDLPWRISDIKRGLILFRTSNNAHGYTNHSTLSDRVDALPDRAKQELAGMMINVATGLDPSVLDRSGYTKGNGELVEAVREAVADLDGGFFRCKKCGHQHDEIGTELDPVDELRKALSDSEGVAPSAKPKTAAEITAIIREWLDSDDPTHWGKFETDLDAALEGVATSGGDAGRDVLAERERQKSVEGWSPEHDDEYHADELVGAAICYAVTPEKQNLFEQFDGADLIGLIWPIGWDYRWFKPKDRRRDLVRAGALIIAEIERLDRAAARSAAQDTQAKPTPTQAEPGWNSNEGVICEGSTNHIEFQPTPSQADVDALVKAATELCASHPLDDAVIDLELALNPFQKG